MAGQQRDEGDRQRRLDLWQSVAWFIVFLITLPLLSGPIIALSGVPEVVAILLVLFVVAGLAWAWLVIRTGGRTLPTSLDSGLLAILLALLIASAASLDPSRSWRVTAHWAAFIVVFYIAVVAVRSDWRTANLVRAYLMVLTLFILAGYAQLLAWLAGRLADGGSLMSGGQIVRVSGLANNPNPFAALLAVGVVLALAAYLDAAEGRRRWPYLAWLITAGPMVIFHGSRNGWLATAAGLAGLLLFRQLRRYSPDRPPRRVWLRWAGFSLLALMATLVLVLVLRPGTLNPATASGYANRSTFWRIALETWLSQPFLGQGPGTFASAFLGSISVPYGPLFVAAHSLLFDTLSEMGLIGILALVLLLWQTIRLAFRALGNGGWRPASPGLLAALLAIAAFSLLDTPWIQLKFVTALILAAFVGGVEPVFSLAEGRSSWRSRLPLLWLPIWAILIIGGIAGWQSAATYGQGATAAGKGRWSEALAHFESAQAWLPYQESSFLLAEGYAAGVLAQSEQEYLDQAIDAYERVVDSEPGWSLNWANLAGLYWQAGRRDEALATMDQALERAPDVAVYNLNHALWLEEAGEDEVATAAYQRLLELDERAGDTAFWSATPVRQAVYQAALVDEPAATDVSPATAEAIALARDGQPEQALQRIEGIATYHSLYGFGRSQRSAYMRDVFVRQSLPAELLPQLRCPLPGEEARRGLEQLRALAEQDGLDELLAFLDNVPLAGHDGLTPCLRPALMVPQSVD